MIAGTVCVRPGWLIGRGLNQARYGTDFRLGQRPVKGIANGLHGRLRQAEQAWRFNCADKYRSRGH
jgi:hypothetical protein